MSEEETEYEVEYISRAQVLKSGKKNVWNFEVKWKGYGIDANTWEPASSFKGSEHFIDSFWAHTQDTRDWHNLKDFKAGEIIFRKGPPRGGKSKGKAKAGAVAKKESTASKRKPADDRAVEVIEDSEPEPEDSTSKAGAISNSVTRKRRASVVEDVEEVSTTKRRRGRPTKASRAEEHSQPSASSGPSLRKTSSASKLPRIPAVKSKSKSKSQLAETSSASASTAVATQGSARGRSSKKSTATPKEPSPEVVLVETPPIADDTSSEADQRLVVESLDIPETESGDTGPPFGDFDDDVEMQDGTSGAVQQVPAETSSRPLPPASPAKIPAHRVREANPRVKVMEGEFTSHSGLHVKAALAGPPGSSKARQSLFSPRTHLDDARTILGSTSLLTAGRNGGLVTVRKHVEPIPSPSPTGAGLDTSLNEAVQDVQSVVEEVVNQVPPTGEEVLELAGLTAGSAEALPDYDDTTDQDAEGESDHDLAGHDDHVAHAEASVLGSGALPRIDTASTTIEVTESRETVITDTNGVSEVREEQTIIIPKPLINSPTALIGHSNSSNIVASTSAAWKHTTIFGPLGFGSVSFTPTNGPSTTQEPSDASRFLVVLGPTVDLPVLLKDVHPARIPSLKSLDSTLAKASRGTPGKFYKEENASKIVSSFGVEGSSARILLDSGATEEQTRNFERFHHLLNDGAVFVSMVGVHLLAFTSSGNVELSSKLGISPNLIGLGDNILVTEVTIQDDSMYLEVTMSLDDERW